MRTQAYLPAFNVGELSEDAWARSDLAQYAKGCVLGLNMLSDVVGPTVRRPGTWFCGLPRYADRLARLIPFQRSQGDALLLEFGDLYARVWTVNGQPVLSGGAPVQFATPWTEAQVPNLRWQQVGDVMFLFHRDGLVPRTLTRLSNTSWSLTETPFNNGPYRGENIDPTKTLRFADVLDPEFPEIAGPTLFASFAAFLPAHVGALFRLRENDGNPPVKSWESSTSVASGELRLSNGRVYRRASTGGGTTGNTPPVHTSGSVSDGGAVWEYVHDGAGVFRITAVLDADRAKVQVLQRGPTNLTTATPYWSEGAYSTVHGWPTAFPAVREERLVLGANAAEPDAADFTRTAGFSPSGLDFKPGLGTGRVVDDDAVRRFVGDERNRLVWLARSTYLTAATTNGEFLITGATLDDPISPSGCVARPLSEFGAADVAPVLAHQSLLFVAAGRQTLIELKVAPDQSFASYDRSVVASHIARRGLAELAWMKQPLNQLHVRLDDKGWASLVYHADQNVLGWNRHSLAGRLRPSEAQPLGGGMDIESLAVLPGLNGRPRLFLLARRPKGGLNQRMILRLADPEDRLFLDAAELYSGTPVNEVGGLDHLAGEEVTVMAATEAGAGSVPGPGWGQYRHRLVSGAGAVALPGGTTAGRLYAGLPYLSRWEGLPPEFAGPGALSGLKVRFISVTLTATLAEAAHGTTTTEEGDSPSETFVSRSRQDLGGPVLRRRVLSQPVSGGADLERRYYVETDSGWDLRVHALKAVVEAHGRS